MPQRPQKVRVSSASFSDWILINRMTTSFGVGLGVSLEDGATLTYTVQHTFDDLYARTQAFSVSRTTTTVTVTKANHGLAVGDWVKITNAPAPFSGEFAVAAVTDVNNFTYTVADAGATSLAAGVGYIQTARVFPHETLASLAVSADGNYAFPPRASRLNVSAYTDGYAELTVIQAGK